MRIIERKVQYSAIEDVPLFYYDLKLLGEKGDVGFAEMRSRTENKLYEPGISTNFVGEPS